MLPFCWSLRDWGRAALASMVGVVFGAVIWWISPIVTGQPKPLDAPGSYYVGSLFVAGLIVALIAPRAFWTAPFTVFLGQLLYCLYLFPSEQNTLWPLDMVVAFVYCLVTLAGGAAGAVFLWVGSCVLAITRFFTRRSRTSDKK